MTEISATHLRPGFQAALNAGFKSMTLKGAWVDRRCVVVDVAVAREMPEHLSNPLSMSLTVPTDIEHTELVRVCRSFGASVERIWRDSNKGQFDRVVSAADGARHIIHRYHHVALCGHKPRMWLSDDEVGPIVNEVQLCAKCVFVSTTKLAYRARWHPDATEVPAAAESPSF